MSKINQLLEKAISTPSEEEAISCLRMARKHGRSESVSVGASSAEEYWKVQANKYYQLAQRASANADKSSASATHFMAEMQKAQLALSRAVVGKNAAELQATIWKYATFLILGMVVAAVVIV